MTSRCQPHPVRRWFGTLAPNVSFFLNAVLFSAGMIVVCCQGQITNSEEVYKISDPHSNETKRVGPLHEGFDPKLPTLWLIGDSTVKNGSDKGDGGMWGWGNPIAAWFDKSKINVENQALGGTSSRSYLTHGLWESVRTQIKPGDFVIMQFGHNDGGKKYDDSRARKSIRGNGDKTLEVTLQDSGKKETVHTFGWYLRNYVKDTKAKGATPIICSLIPRNVWKKGKVQRATNSYAKWAREAADESGAYFVDLNAIIADRYDKLGQVAVKPLFPNEHTHTSWDGAILNAECVVQGIRQLKDCPLKNYLLPEPKRPIQPTPPNWP